MTPPDYLDWDLWLGPAPARPYHEVYFPGPKWYRWWDFGNGTMSDLGSHWNDLPFWALDLDAPLTIEAGGPPAHDELAALPRKYDLVFTTTGQTPVSGFSRAKKRLDRLLVEDFPAWRLHDLRTAFATEMAEGGESEVVVDRILNHVASVSAASAVARVYNRAEQLPQRARALERSPHPDGRL